SSEPRKIPAPPDRYPAWRGAPGVRRPSDRSGRFRTRLRLSTQLDRLLLFVRLYRRWSMKRWSRRDVLKTSLAAPAARLSTAPGFASLAQPERADRDDRTVPSKRYG